MVNGYMRLGIIEMLELCTLPRGLLRIECIYVSSKCALMSAHGKVQKDHIKDQVLFLLSRLRLKGRLGQDRAGGEGLGGWYHQNISKSTSLR